MLPEELAREKIDKQLKRAGWDIVSRDEYTPNTTSAVKEALMNYKENGLIDGRGIGLQGFSSKRVHHLVVPLPPLEEQKRIENKIDELLSLIA